MNAVAQLQPQGGAVAAQSPAATRMAVSDVIQHYAMVQEVKQAIMKPKVHYDTIPGTPKPTLLKPGAEALCMAFRVSDDYLVEDLSTPDEVRYRVKCIGAHQVVQHKLGEGMGEASSSEEKYKWRKAVCDEEWDETPANLRRVKYGKDRGGGFYKQKQIRTEPADMRNTVLKMALKRAKVGMTINVTACSDMFSQDLEDLDEATREHLARHGEESQEQAGGEQQDAGLPAWPDDKLEQRFPKWREGLAAGKTHDEIIAFAEQKGTLSDVQKAKIRALTPAEKPAAAGAASEVTDAAPKVSLASVADRIIRAKTLDQVAEAETLIPAIENPEHRKEAEEKAAARRAELGEQEA